LTKLGAPFCEHGVVVCEAQIIIIISTQTPNLAHPQVTSCGPESVSALI